MERVRLKREEESEGIYFIQDSPNQEFISTGSVLLDCALGGGWCLGRIGNIVGDKSTAKTGLAIEAMANFAIQYPSGKIYYRESESAFNPQYAATLGMPIGRVDFGEEEDFYTVEDFEKNLSEKLDEIEHLHVPGLYIVDSLDGLSDEAEIKRDIGEGSYNTAKAKLMGQLFRKLVQKIEHSRMFLLIISQERDKIGAMFGKKTTRSGGRALDFYATHVVWLAHIKTLPKTIKGIERPIGIKIKAKVEKNKISAPFRQAEFDYIFGMGIDNIISGVDWLKEVKRIDSLGYDNDKELISWIKEVNKMNDTDYWSAVAKVNAAVKEVWQEVEEGFLPARRKYQES